MIARQQTFIDRLVDLVKIVMRESGNRKKKVCIVIPVPYVYFIISPESQIVKTLTVHGLV